MKFDNRYFRKRWGPATTALCTAVLLYVILTHLNVIFSGIGKFLGFLSPVFVGLIIAYVVDPLTVVFEKKVLKKVKTYHLRRNLSVLFSVLIILVGIIFLMVALIPQVVDSITSLIGNLDSYAKTAKDMLSSLSDQMENLDIDISGIVESVGNAIDSLISKVPSNLTDYFNTAVSLSRRAVNIVIACILAIYFLADKVRLQNWFKRLYRAVVLDRTYESSAAFWDRCNKILIHFIIYDLLDGMIVGVANYIFMTIVRMPFSVLISVVVGVTNLAPTFGPIIGGVIGAVILVLINPWYALWFLIFTIILQTFDGYILKPKLFGTLLGVSGVWILVCLVVGGRMFGVTGVLLGIPFAAISSFIYTEYIMVKLKKRKERREKQAAQGMAEADESAKAVDDPENAVTGGDEEVRK